MLLEHRYGCAAALPSSPARSRCPFCTERLRLSCGSNTLNIACTPSRMGSPLAMCSNHIAGTPAGWDRSAQRGAPAASAEAHRATVQDKIAMTNTTGCNRRCGHNHLLNVTVSASASMACCERPRCRRCVARVPCDPARKPPAGLSWHAAAQRPGILRLP